MKSLNKINDIFGVDTEVDLPKDAPIMNYEPAELDQEDDFQLARNTLRNLINKNEDVMNELVHIAKNSENPRAFEVTGQLISAQTAITKELIGLHKTKKDIDKASGKVENIKQQNNIVFAGSTSDLMKMINGDKSKIIDAK
jgi:hypothetical protein